MARATFVKKARKAIKGTDIKKGDSYYWWKFWFGPKRCSKTAPRRSQLTQSAYYAALYDAEDMVSDFKVTKDTTADDLKQLCDDVASAIREAGDECQNSFDNMPEGLQQGDTGQLLEQRVSDCDSMADEFESVDTDDKEDGETDEEFIERKLEEIQGIGWEIN